MTIISNLMKLAVAFTSVAEIARAGIPSHKIHMRAYEKPDSVYHVALIGERIRIESTENPSTGFKWLVEQFDSEVLKVNEFNYVPGAGSEDRVGAGGKRFLEVECKGAGRHSVRMAHVREWEWDGFESVNAENYDTRGNPVHSVVIMCLVDSEADEENKDSNAVHDEL